MDDLETTLKRIPDLLRQREEALAARERDVKKLKETLEKENPCLGRPSDVLRLNVGGKRIDVLRRTLTQVEGSMLESKFSGRWDDNLEKDADGNFFIDQPAELFVPLVNYLRAKQSETPLAQLTKPPLFNTSREEEDFRRIVEYYGVTLGVYPIGLYRLVERKEANGTDWTLCDNDDFIIEAQEWATFSLRQLEGCHSRSVASYEVTVEHGSNAQIGWLSGSMSDYRNTESGRGVGYGSHSMAIDCVKTCVVVNGKTHSLPAGSISVGGDCTIRSQDFGALWYVDGRLVAASSSAKKGVDVVEFKMNSSGVPALSIKGKCRISKIELRL